MRSIKFRAWEPETEMGKPGSMSYNQDFCFSQIQHPDGIIIMQFTDLQDKNGKEIYEGDVVKAADEDSPHIKKWVVDFESGRFVATNSRDTIGLHYWADIQIEIIGNIYENPELLKEGK